MTDASIIDEIEGHYESVDGRYGSGVCDGCRQDWPCLTRRLVEELERLLDKWGKVGLDEAFHLAHARNAIERLEKRGKRDRRRIRHLEAMLDGPVKSNSMTLTAGQAEIREQLAELLLLDACHRFHPGEHCKPGQNHPAVNR